MKSAVVTGVSTGIGAGIAASLIRAGWQVFGSVRSDAAGAAARSLHGALLHPLVFDVTDEKSVVAAASVVEKELGGRLLDALVNNAGIALAGPLLVQSTADFRHQIEVNLIGPFVVTKAFAGLLGATAQAPPGRRRVINISSVGGRIAAPFLGAYAASKHGMEGMSASLRRELQIYGIDVIIVGPGSVATPIWDKAEGNETAELKGTIWETPFRNFLDFLIKDGRKGYAPSVIGDTVLKVLTASKPATRYAPVPNKFVNWVLPTRLPARVIDGLIGKQLGLIKIE